MPRILLLAVAFGLLGCGLAFAQAEFDIAAELTKKVITTVVKAPAKIVDYNKTVKAQAVAAAETPIDDVTAATPAATPAPAAAAADAPADAAPAAAPAQGGWLKRTLTAMNPATLVNTVRTNNAAHNFYATDYTVHDTRRAAIARSIQPKDMRLNVKASLKNNTNVLNLAGSLITPLAMELQRELVTDGHITPSKLARSLQPGAIVGGAAGGLVGDACGAAVQSALASACGPVGPALGFVARPIVSYAGYLIGSNFGRTVQGGKPSFKTALAESMRQIDPMRDAGSLIGGSVGCVVGQALIPIPVVGGMIGGMVGGLLGTAIGNFIGHHGPTGALNEKLISWLHKKADRLEGKGEKKDEAAKEDGPTATRAAEDVQLLGETPGQSASATPRSTELDPVCSMTTQLAAAR